MDLAAPPFDRTSRAYRRRWWILAVLDLSLLAVNAQLQRKGIGRALVTWLEQSALIAGIDEIHLELRANNHGARAFYDALGFKLNDSVRGYYRGEESALRMRKVIGMPTAPAEDIAAGVAIILFKIR